MAGILWVVWDLAGARVVTATAAVVAGGGDTVAGGGGGGRAGWGGDRVRKLSTGFTPGTSSSPGVGTGITNY